MMEHLDPAPQRVAETREAERHDHEFLHVHGIVRVLSAVDDVHHGHGQNVGGDTPDVTIQGLCRE